MLSHKNRIAQKKSLKTNCYKDIRERGNDRGCNSSNSLSTFTVSISQSTEIAKHCSFQNSKAHKLSGTQLWQKLEISEQEVHGKTIAGNNTFCGKLSYNFGDLFISH